MKIYDTFTFFNELDLLDIRLNVLNDVVDYFVLVEATRTFQNKEKPLYFAEYKDRYSAYLHKIIHVVVDDMPDSSNTRALEAHQRNAILRGLVACKEVDQVILSDVDEIPNPEKVVDAARSRGIKAFRQGLYYYYINCACQEMTGLPWSIMASHSEFQLPQLMRQKVIALQAALLGGRSDVGVQLIDGGGWHFSYLGGSEAIVNKLSAFADPEYNKSCYRDVNRITEAIAHGRDLFGRNLHFSRVPIDDRFPEYIRLNRDQISHLIDG